MVITKREYDATDGAIAVLYAKRDGNQTVSYPVIADSSGKLILSSLIPYEYDQIDLTYVPSGSGEGEIQTATFKSGGATVATLTLTYDSNNRITSVART